MSANHTNTLQKPGNVWEIIPKNYNKPGYMWANHTIALQVYIQVHALDREIMYGNSKHQSTTDFTCLVCIILKIRSYRSHRYFLPKLSMECQVSVFSYSNTKTEKGYSSSSKDTADLTPLLCSYPEKFMDSISQSLIMECYLSSV